MATGYTFPYDKTELWSYYDWAITGSNCVVYLARPYDDDTSVVTRQLNSVPVLAVGYNIQQQKAPVYGYADRKPRKILNGQSIVSGQLIVAHREVGFLKKVLMEAGNDIYGSKDKLDLKENLRLQYWNTRDWKNVEKDPQRRSFPVDEQYNLFYEHPNFDITIVYGVGDYVKSVYNNGKLDLKEVVNLQKVWYNQKSQEYNDVNPLYIPKDANIGKQRETIASVQLTGMQKTIAADGEIIVEAYSFLAIDVLEQ